MAPRYDRETLEGMKRSDLQRICKDHGIKANLKSEALIDLLLDTTQPRRPEPPPQPQRASSMRIVSHSTVGSRLRSGGSMIVHDTDDEGDEEPEPENPAPVPSSKPLSEPAPASRPRKAKATQYRLGVGRPTAAGGSGARAATRSLSVSKDKRGRGSKSVKPSEEVIQEEDEGPEDDDTASPVAGPSKPASMPAPTQLTATASLESVSSTGMPDEVRAYVSKKLRPLQSQIETLQSELQRATQEAQEAATLKSAIASLSTQMEGLRAQASATEDLKAEIALLRETLHALHLNGAPQRSESSKSAGKARAVDTPDSDSTGYKTLQPTATLLGKRQREGTDSDIGTPTPDALLRPSKPAVGNVLQPKKRQKISEKAGPGPSALGAGDPQQVEGDDDVAIEVPAPGPAFTVFTGPEEPPEGYIDPPPPGDRLSDFLAFPSSGTTPPSHNSNGPQTTTANGQENARQDYGFFPSSAFHPMTSTPAAPYDLTFPSFVYPEPPTSPTPGASQPTGGYVQRAGGRRERNDLYQPIGRGRPGSAPKRTSRTPSRATPSRPTSAAPAVPEGTIDPANLHSPMLPAVLESEPNTSLTEPVATSTEIGHGLGMADMPLHPETPAPPTKRTMYGTELEGDTRFGDFGVEGVATGFWVGSAPRF